VNNDSPQKALLVVFLVALVCSILVSLAAITLKPLQLRNQLVERSRNIIALTGLLPGDAKLSDEQILAALEQLDIRVVNIDSGEFDATIDPVGFDARAAVGDPELGVAIPADADAARLGRRARYAVVYLVWDGDALSRVIVPVHGQGMWSMLYGYLALEADLNTIAAVSFYEQTETAGLGDQIQRPDWQAQWTGRQLFDSRGSLRFRVASGVVEVGAPAARYEVDGLTGASVTADAVTRLIAYWFGAHGYANLLDRLRDNPPERVMMDGDILR
jgi:Na+-transporting NADH:ubiquinone oxidoreductase subunit C